MKHPVIILCAAALLGSLMTEPARAMRCNGRIISVGDPKDKVLTLCGDPAWTDQREEERIVRHCPDAYGPEGFEREWNTYEFRRYGRRFKACKIHVTIDEWFYNFGPGRFTQTLYFENNRLVHIEPGDYGY